MSICDSRHEALRVRIVRLLDLRQKYSENSPPSLKDISHAVRTQTGSVKEACGVLEYEGILDSAPAIEEGVRNYWLTEYGTHFLTCLEEDR